MLNSRMKDKIYAFLSFLSIILAIGSFAAVIGFLLKTNEYIFSVNEKTVKEKTTVADKAGFENIKARLNLKEDNNAVAPQEEEKTILENLLNFSSESSLSPLPAISPSPSSVTSPLPSSESAAGKAGALDNAEISISDSKE